MPAYFVAIREVTTDPAELAEYGAKVSATFEGVNMRRLARYGKLRITEGDAAEGVVITEFPSFEEAEAWYDSPAYQDVVQHRFKGAKYRTFIVDGVRPGG